MFRLVLMGPCVRSGSPSYLKREELPFPFCRPAETPAPVLANQNKKEKTLLWFPKTKRKLCPRKKKGQFNGTKKWPLKWPTTWPDYTAVSPTLKKNLFEADLLEMCPLPGKIWLSLATLSGLNGADPGSRDWRLIGAAGQLMRASFE